MSALCAECQTRLDEWFECSCGATLCTGGWFSKKCIPNHERRCLVNVNPPPRVPQGEEPSPAESDEIEVDPDDLAAAVAARLAECGQDLHLLADVFAELEPESREALLKQLRYLSELSVFLGDEG